MKTKIQSAQLILSIIGLISGIILLIISAFLAENRIISPTCAVIFVMVSVSVILVSVFFAAKIDYESGLYVCRKCNYRFKPTFTAYIFGAHTLTTRHLKCPKCNKRSWCQRINIK